jgi:hypothetical protein
MFRQGDVLLVPVEAAAVPLTAVPAPRDRSGRLVLARGETTGHAHVISGTGVQLLADRDDVDRLFVQIDEAGLLAHDERADITVPAGHYRVVRQRAYTPGPAGPDAPGRRR